MLLSEGNGQTLNEKSSHMVIFNWNVKLSLLFRREVRFQSSALDALQDAAEAYIVRLLTKAILL